MSSILQYLVRNMLALTIAPSPDKKALYIVEEDEGSLIQSLITDGKPGIREEIAEEVKQGTPALYLVVDGKDEEERLVLYLDESDELCCSRYNSESYEWEEGEFEGISSPLVVHPGTRLSGFSNLNETKVIYQNPALELEIMSMRNGSWTTGGKIPVEAQAGAPHVTMDSPDQIHVFYLRKDNQIGHAMQQYKTGVWKDTVLQNSLFDTQVSHFLVIPVDTQGSFDVYAAAGDKLVRIEANGKRQELGRINKSKLIPLTNEECAPYVPWALGFASFLIGFSFGSQHLRRPGVGQQPEAPVPLVGGAF
ncbi:hypothetical protein BDV40DRAFT_299126 [Aspergillus tamarii]|uniref:Fucose-specific lectin n=1 Tax=Aspergillus tamarii TaxID=41984 RepID=A0A5N6UZ76_ASPTM|nr:hypothetical protein BDV40DRAFT_299126 [Aspergillus tamarii]